MKWCAFSGAYDCPLRNVKDIYCDESLLKGYCKMKYPKSEETLFEKEDKKNETTVPK